MTVQPHFFARAINHFGGKIPFIVSELLFKLMDMEAEKEEGIFRLSGLGNEIADLCMELDKGMIADWSKYQNPHSLACALKRFLASTNMAEPIFQPEVRAELLRIPDSGPPDHVIACYRAVVHALDRPRKLSLALLFMYVDRIVECQETSKMGPNNMAIVLSPNLFQAPPNETVAESLEANTKQTRTIQLLIEHSQAIFSDTIIPESAFLVPDEIPRISVQPFRKPDVERMLKLVEIRKNSTITIVPQIRAT